ncbi:MAG TPA: hypothetical protein VE888_21670 [Streptosporangiaceae bacterium]|nr:hypothetical protein [Streptosporangiaceae bacterium]
MVAYSWLAPPRARLSRDVAVGAKKLTDAAGDALTYQGITALTGAAGESQARPAPGCAWTYSAQAHPASPAPSGTMLVSWASGHDDPGTTCDMQPQFTDLPIGSPPPRTDGSGCGPPTGGDNRFP